MTEALSSLSSISSLQEKYRRMLELRRASAGNEARSQLRALAQGWPGALRELDRLPTDEIEGRILALEAALAGGEIADWMRWLDAYHGLMRDALAIRAGRDSGDPAFVAAVRAPPHGRLMAAVMDALAARFAVPASQIWDALFPSTGGRKYR